MNASRDEIDPINFGNLDFFDDVSTGLALVDLEAETKGSVSSMAVSLKVEESGCCLCEEDRVCM